VWAKKVSYCTFSISSLNINQFLQFFNQWTLEEIPYSVACTPHLLCRFTTLENINIQKRTITTDGNKVN